MTLEQKEALREAVNDNPELLLDALGIEYEYRSGTLKFLCPFHDDKHIGNCGWVNKGFGFVHCFACGKSADCFDLVQYVQKINFASAAYFISKTYGIGISSENPEDYVRDPYFDVKLSAAEKEALRIPNEIPLRTLFNESPESYRSIIVKNAVQSIEQYKTVIDKFGARDAEEAYKIYHLTDGKATPQTYEEIKNKMKDQIQTCESVIAKMEDESI